MSKEEKAIELGDILLQNLLKENEALLKEKAILEQQISELKAKAAIRNSYVEKISSLNDPDRLIRLALEKEVD